MIQPRRKFSEYISEYVTDADLSSSNSTSKLTLWMITAHYEINNVHIVGRSERLCCNINKMGNGVRIKRILILTSGYVKKHNIIWQTNMA